MKKKINLEAFKVESFVTDMNQIEQKTVNGGDKLTVKGCDSRAFKCGTNLDTKYYYGPCGAASRIC